MDISNCHIPAIFPPNIKNSFEDELVLTNPIPTYKQARTNRLNARYSVIQVRNESVIQATIGLITRLSVMDNHKVLVFCLSVQEIVALVEPLQWCMYYSKWEGKYRSLEDW